MRIVRHLSFANVIAVIALFVALGGAAYAGSKIDGNSIVGSSIGGGKLKNETITAKKIKKGTITGTQIKGGSIDSSAIDLSTLGTVPSAQTATSAQTAASATTAQSARTAETATRATEAVTATTATSADTAKHAEEADTARHATEAASATTAAHADEADRATIAGEAEALGGKSAAELTVSCSISTEPYGGMCWDKVTRPVKPWLIAVSVCGDAGGRLPSIGELIAFVLRPGEQVEGQVWSSDLAEVAGSTETVLTSNESSRGKKEGGGFSLGYRCVFPPTN